MIVLRADRHEPCPGSKKDIQEGHMFNLLWEGGAEVAREKYLKFYMIRVTRIKSDPRIMSSLYFTKYL